jgi:hypothetical protein
MSEGVPTSRFGVKVTATKQYRVTYSNAFLIPAC